MHRDSPIQAVSFDVGGTLIAPHPSVGHVYAAVAARNGLPGLDPALLDRRFAMAWGRAVPFQHRREDWARLVDDVFNGMVKNRPSSTFFPELYAEFGKERVWRVFDDVIPTLDALAARGIDLAIVSNWDERLRRLLRVLKLDRYFSCIAVSCETGFPKPSRVIFEEALRGLGRPASAVLHVGDSLAEDFAGATAAGLAALHLRRNTPPGDGQIGSLEEILPWLAGG